MYVMNLGKPTKVAKLNDAMAIELGASLIGEVIIFSVATLCLVLELTRQSIKEAKKEEVRLMQLEKFTNDIQALHELTLKQESEIEYLKQSVEELAAKAKHTLTVKKVVYNQDKKEDDKTDSEVNNRSIFRRALAFYEGDSKKKEKLS